MVDRARPLPRHSRLVSGLGHLRRFSTLFSMIVASLGALPALAKPPQFVALGTADVQPLYLHVELNGQPTGKIMRLSAHASKDCARKTVLYVREEDLSELGMLTAQAGVAPHTDVMLDTVTGLSYRYDAAQQAISFSIEYALLRPFVLDANTIAAASVSATATRGWALNYDALFQTSGTTRAAIFNELRYFDRFGVLSSNGTAYSGTGRGNDEGGARGASSNRRRSGGYKPYMFAQRSHYIRYDTSWRHSDPATLSVVQFGDAISGALDWTRSVRMAGLQWRSNFELRPDLVTFPVSQVGSSAVVPSAVSLYVNGVRRYDTEVPAGPFVINQPPGITGAGVATLVTRDALGRHVTTSVPLYVDTRLLTRGLSSFSAEAGFLRRRFGYASFDYGHHPVVSGSFRRGLTDGLTLETHAEATRGIVNAGAGALFGLGGMGVLSASLATSSGRHPGMQAGLGYQYVSQRFSLAVQTLRSSKRYGDIGTSTGTVVPTAIDRASLSFPLSEGQSVAANYFGFRSARAKGSRIGALSYSVSLGRQVSLYVSAHQDIDRGHSRAAFINLSIGLGARTMATVSGVTQNGRTSYNAAVAQYADYDGGWGWAARRSTQGDRGYTQGQLNYLGRYGQGYGWVQNNAGRTHASINATGALVLMDGHIAAARRIDNGFALVSTNGVPNVEVLHENRRLGLTNSSGYLLVPDLNPYQNNKIGIDPTDLPLDAQVGNTEQNIVPQYRSGVLAIFEVDRYFAATVILHDDQGRTLPVGMRVRHVESGRSTVLGYDGMAFIKDLRAQNHLVVIGHGFECEVTFPYQSDSAPGLSTIGPLTCKKSNSTTPT